MPRTHGPMTNWSQYLAARAAATALTMFNVETNLRTASLMGRLLHRFDRRHRERAMYHLRLAFPDWDDGQLEHVCEQSFEHFVQLATEVMHTPRLLHTDSWAQHVVINNLGPAIELLNANRPVILLTGHLGNWEVLGFVLAVLGYDVDALARPIDNPLVNDWLMGIRQQRGMRIITKWDATDHMMHVLDNGGALGFIADQNAGAKGLFVPFFGRLASTYKSIGLLAMNRHVPIVCGYAHRIGPGFRYEIGQTDIIYPEQWEDRPDPLYYITARYCRAMETAVRQRPAQYLWMHRRWKSRPRHEVQGRPFPASLRHQIESLPWMTDDLLRELQKPVAMVK